MLSNPFSLGALQGLAIAGVSSALFLAVARGADKFVATRKPKDGNEPWYGRNAVAAYQRRPDAMRLGVQAGGALVGLAGAYFSRGMKYLPWVFGGAASGFASNLALQVIEWWVIPKALPVKADNPRSLANRITPLEQYDVQDAVTTMFENYGQVASLAAQQAGGPVLNPLGVPGIPSTGPVYALGKGQADAPKQVAGDVGEPGFLNTGRLGICPDCGGLNGCRTNCPTQCPNCEGYKPFSKCAYTVQGGDDLAKIAAVAGVGIGAVNALNGGTPEQYWRVGNKVVMPYGACRVLERQSSAVQGVPEQVPAPVQAPIDLRNFGQQEE